MGEERDPATLEEARELIDRQRQQIEQLRRRVEADRFAEDLREALTLAAATGTIGSPVGYARLLEIIVETAAAVIGAKAGSLLLIDHATQELVFEQAIGPEGEKIEGTRMPATRGIAGLVATTGQPMAVTNADEDQRVFTDVGERVGYQPETLLCVPLLEGDRVLGVFEMLDKGGDAPFTPDDMYTLGLFAGMAAVAIELSRTYRHIAPLIVQLLTAAAGERGEAAPTSLTQRAEEFAANLEEEEVSYQEAIELAKLVQEIAWRGDSERVAVLTILRGFADFLRTHPALGVGR